MKGFQKILLFIFLSNPKPIHETCTNETKTGYINILILSIMLG